MEPNATLCYRAVQARDARYDGRFFTCVRTTGVYCRPICPARPPNLEKRFQSAALAALGMPRARAMTLAGIAQAAISDRRLFDLRRDLQETVAALRELEGVGEWTAQYIAMRAMGECDAFLAADAALRRKLATYGLRQSTSELLARAEHWRPWRAYALLHLWMADANRGEVLSTKEVCHALTA